MTILRFHNFGNAIMDPLESPCVGEQVATCGELGSANLISTTEITPRDGRRIYIHLDSFRHLASTGEEIAHEVCEALVAIALIKLVHHELCQEAVLRGTIESSEAEAILNTIESHWSKKISSLLNKCQILSMRLEQSVEQRIILREGEEICATCIDDGYVTFATGEAAAERMYLDVEPMKRVRYLMSLGDSNYQDLTLIRGKNLISIDVHSSDVEWRKNAETQPPSRLSEDDLDSIYTRVLDACLADAYETMTMLVSLGTPQVHAEILNLLEKCFSTMARLMFRKRVLA